MSRRERAANEFHARPHAAGILPAAAGPAEPLAQQRAGEHQPPFVLRQRTIERPRLGGRAHANGDERGEQVRGDGEARTFWDVVDAADQLKAPRGPDDAGQQIRKLLPRNAKISLTRP